MSLQSKSWFEVRGSWLAAILCLGLLTACGFKPVYGHKDGGDSGGAGVVVAAPGEQNRMDQQFKADLEDKLNPAGRVPANARFRLETTLTSTAGAIGVARDGTVSRYNIYLRSNYKLIRLSDDKQVAIGTLQHVSSYNNPTNQYFSTYMSEQDATTRGVTELAELYKQRLSPYLVMTDREIAALSAIAPAAAKPAVTPPLLLPGQMDLIGGPFQPKP